MRILGIDPGTHACGWGVVELTGRKNHHLAHGVVRLKGELPVRLGALHEALSDVVRQWQPDEVAVEAVFTHKSAKSALVLGHARGIALLAAAQAGLPVADYPPARVKKTIVGTGRADKAQMQVMVGALLGIQAPKSNDAADALAIAICHCHHLGGQLGGATAAVKSYRKGGAR